MPTYDYRCDANGQTLEVSHRMNDHLQTWGELCAKLGIEPGDTPAASPVKRLATGGNLVTSSALGSGTEPACNTGSCCPGGMCGIN